MQGRPLILGIAGKKRHGKDVISSVMSEHYGIHRIAFADELKRIAMHLWGLTFEQVYGDDLKEVEDPRWGLSPRVFLQRLGTQVGREIHPETWVRFTLNTIQKAFQGEPVLLPDLINREFREFRFDAGHAHTWSIPDARFPSEASAIRAIGGLVIKVVRPSLISNDTHASETEVDNIVGDINILNDGSVEDLKDKVRSIIPMVTS